MRIVATDDDSSSNGIDVPDAVVRQDARQAVRARQPAVVICSWPSPGNSFERKVFRTPSVELYVVIPSVHHFAAGDWRAYTERSDFTGAQDEGSAG